MAESSDPASSNSQIVITGSESESDNELEMNHDDSTGTSWHPVWSYFKQSKGNDGRKIGWCIIQVGPSHAQQACNYKLPNSFSTNAMNHLKSHHKKEYKAAMDERNKVKKRKAPKAVEVESGQQPLPFTRVVKKYSSQNPKQRIVSKKLVKVFVAKSIPISLIDDDGFRDVLTSLDEKYDPPSSYLLRQEMTTSFKIMKENIMDAIEKSGKVAITADIWTKRGGTESFFGVTAHWFDSKHWKIMSATLAIQKLEGSHVASLIYDTTMKILTSWNIPQSKVSRVVTDNGSNMAKAFQDEFQIVAAEDVGLDDRSNGETDGGWDDQMEDDESGDQYQINAMGLEDSFVESNDQDVEGEITEYDAAEDDVNRSFIGIRRLGCFAHTLQCAVRNLDKSKFAAPARKKAFKLIESFSKSPKATQMLIEKSRKKLLTTCRTRWSYNCLALRRLLELKPAIDEITVALKTIDNLRNSEWTDIERYVSFMQKFADVTYSIEGHKAPTLSEVIPQLIELNGHLNQKKDVNGFKAASEKLLLELEDRFSYITDPSHYKFDPIYVVATALDPRWRLALNDRQMDAARREIMNLITDNASNQVDDAALGPADDQPSVSSTSRFEFVSSLMQQKQRAHEAMTLNPASEEIAGYFGTQHSLNFDENPLVFWKDWKGKYSQLASLAQDVLVIPATSAPVERLFSQTSIATSGKRNRLAGAKLEREVMMKTNKDFF